MNLLGLSAFYHDSATCLVRDGEIIAAAQEERFTRKKRDHDFPTNAMQYCLQEGGLGPGDLDLVAFYDKPFIKFERLLTTYLAYAPAGLPAFIKAMPLWMKDLIQKKLNFSGKTIFPEHHESHAASAFYPSPFEEAAFLTMDGVGEWATASYGIGRGNQIELLAELHFPHSFLTMTSARFARLFGGPPRKPEAALTQREMDLARSVQEVTEEIMLRMCRHVHHETGQKN